MGAAFGLALCAFEFGLDFLVLNSHDLPRWMVYVVDGITGTIAVFLFMRIFSLQAARQADTEARLATIAEMNHHIRNALQVIAYWVREEKDEEQVRMLRESVERIEWALRDILPRAVQAQAMPPAKPIVKVESPRRSAQA